MRRRGSWCRGEIISNTLLRVWAHTPPAVGKKKYRFGFHWKITEKSKVSVVRENNCPSPLLHCAYHNCTEWFLYPVCFSQIASNRLKNAYKLCSEASSTPYSLELWLKEQLTRSIMLLFGQPFRSPQNNRGHIGAKTFTVVNSNRHYVGMLYLLWNWQRGAFIVHRWRLEHSIYGSIYHENT